MTSSFPDNDNKSTRQYNNLMSSCRIGKMNLKNRLVVPSLTRLRADDQTKCINELSQFYYSQRYHNGLIITENCLVTSEYSAFRGQPGIYNSKQIAAWRDVVDKVHSRATNIVISLFHPGRVVGKGNSQNEPYQAPLSPSGIKIDGSNNLVNGEFAKPVEMSTKDIINAIELFKQAALNAKEAGFDGIQIECGGGYLIDQFLQTETNQRIDNYGGSLENRARFCLEVVDEILAVLPKHFVSIKISPLSTNFMNLRSMDDQTNQQAEQDRMDQAMYLLEEINKREICFVEVRYKGKLDSYFQVKDPMKQSTISQVKSIISDTDGFGKEDSGLLSFFAKIRTFYQGNLIANADFGTITIANSIIMDIGYQACSFDMLSISNPDLPQRLQEKGNINWSPRELFLFKGGRHGYVDYPFYIAHSKL